MPLWFERWKTRRHRPSAHISTRPGSARAEGYGYLLYGFVKHSEFSVTAEVKLLDAEKAAVAASFFNSDDSSHYPRLMKDLAVRIEEYFCRGHRVEPSDAKTGNPAQPAEHTRVSRVLDARGRRVEHRARGTGQRESRVPVSFPRARSSRSSPGRGSSLWASRRNTRSG